jgi:prepilin-type N-terminal cleavage/methylation domain-containing protein
MFKKAFTLIELLIVVAIIAILAAIAVPNFLEAQTRAKVTKCVAHMKVIVNAIEAYRVDYNDFPVIITQAQMDSLPFPYFTGGWVMVSNMPGNNYFGSRLTTPIQYLTSIPFDPFNSHLLESVFGFTNAYSNSEWSVIFSGVPREYRSLVHHYPVGLLGRAQSYEYVMESCGPNLTWESQGIPNTPGPIGPYDPTNGTVSNGNIMYYHPHGFSHIL